jgi:hypothetical protein
MDIKGCGNLTAESAPVGLDAAISSDFQKNSPAREAILSEDRIERQECHVTVSDVWFADCLEEMSWLQPARCVSCGSFDNDEDAAEAIPERSRIRGALPRCPV